jgi:hypothetical protein
VLRNLVVLGAMAVIPFAKPGHASPWLLNLLRFSNQIAYPAFLKKLRHSCGW